MSKITIRNASRSHTTGQVLVLPVLQSGLIGHCATKPKLLEKWTCTLQLLYGCLITSQIESIQCDVALQCHGSKNGIYLFNCKARLYCKARLFAYNNFTYTFNINISRLQCHHIQKIKDALNLIVGDYPESSNLPTSDMLSRRSMGPTSY